MLTRSRRMPVRPAYRIGTVAFLLLLAAALPVAVIAEEEEGFFEVDYAKRLGNQKSMIGMIHGADTREVEIGEYTDPPFDDFIAPLGFQVWETGGAMLRKNFITMIENASEGAKATLRLNAGDAEPEGCEYIGDPRRPYLDPEMYSTYVSCVAEWARDNGIYAMLLWNEPNLTAEFLGDYGQPWTAMDRFHETYHIGHNAIRSVWPEARIAGPALAKQDQEEWLAAFMEYLLANDLTVDVISLHETQYTVNDFSWAGEFIRDIRADYIDNPDYASVGVKEIIVSESTYKDYNEIPASNLAVWFYFEKGGADAAGRACWDVPGGKCFQDTLNGLVTTPDEFGKRHRTPAWWTTFHYNRTLRNRAQVTRSHERLIGMANDNVVMMAAYREADDPRTDEFPIRVTLRNLDDLSWLSPAEDSIHIRIREIPRLEKNVKLDSVPVLSDIDVAIQTDADGSRYVDTVLTTPAHVVRVLELSPSE